MADLLNLPPTRSTLLQLQQELEQARHGYELLERKREVLARELLLLIHDAEKAEAEARKCFGAAYDALTEARMRMGTDRLHWVSLTPTAKMEARVKQRSVMGVIVPLVDLDIAPLPLAYGLGDTSAALDEGAGEMDRCGADARSLGRNHHNGVAAVHRVTEDDAAGERTGTCCHPPICSHDPSHFRHIGRTRA